MSRHGGRCRCCLPQNQSFCHDPRPARSAQDGSHHGIQGRRFAAQFSHLHMEFKSSAVGSQTQTCWADFRATAIQKAGLPPGSPVRFLWDGCEVEEPDDRLMTTIAKDGDSFVLIPVWHHDEPRAAKKSSPSTAAANSSGTGGMQHGSVETAGPSAAAHSQPLTKNHMDVASVWPPSKAIALAGGSLASGPAGPTGTGVKARTSSKSSDQAEGLLVETSGRRHGESSNGDGHAPNTQNQRSQSIESGEPHGSCP